MKISVRQRTRSDHHAPKSHSNVGALPQTKRPPVRALLGLLASAAGLVLFVEARRPPTTRSRSTSRQTGTPPPGLRRLPLLRALDRLRPGPPALNPAGRAARCFAWVGTPVLVVLYAGTLASTVASVLGTGRPTSSAFCGPCRPRRPPAWGKPGSTWPCPVLRPMKHERDRPVPCRVRALVARPGALGGRRLPGGPPLPRRCPPHRPAPLCPEERRRGPGHPCLLERHHRGRVERLAEYEAYVAQG